MAPYRDFQTGGQGTPEGDVNKYYMLSNGELDYDSPFISQIGYGDPDWMWPPPRIVDLLRLGGDVRFLLSFGPFDVSPGEQIDFALALVAGENLHTVPRNLANLDVGNVEAYYDRLDFSNIARNATWAKWVYDNPGVDTDGDGYAGDFRVCIKDSVFQNGQWYYDVPETTYYRGDGVPDWRAAGPPPPPVVWLHPTLDGIRVRFNGQLSETTKDIFSGIVDFEGYRIYWGRDERDYSLSLVASYDRENYDKWVWEPHLYGGGAYVIQEIPFSLDDLKCLYGQGGDPCADSLFDPLFFTSGNPYVLPGFSDSVFYFTRHDANQSNLGVTTPIKKVYPNQPPPVPGEEPEADDLTEDGYLKYYEYEFTIKNLLPTVPYYVNVTAFDFGSPESGLEALETDKQLNIQYAYPYSDPEQLGHEKQPVYIYPNPWRGDAGYRNRGFEGRARENFPEFRTREIHFENLPAHCWIKIFTIDGDLVRAIRHDVDPSDPNFRHDSWDMINRNAQLVKSGIYYWAVEDDSGHVEMGKLVIIM